ncbi:hypothetical protein DFQ05_1810 [Winogradskyella wandonensis]|uniref:Uncharacterized protein n=1 Tax=Winogradskyella wandonensis TaxID=1442586 RepID=A0A4R1KSJ7_9FLAO|nr:hypothetical protein [Winogradskyella wandonensis]TCK68026.1 hypothetical protein DFQ05_1810 [Winogradskyella wandonensis]
MIKRANHRIAMFFALLFVSIVAAPAVILSMDDDVDVTFFFGENEEEEKENIKLLFEECFIESAGNNLAYVANNFDGYTLKNYPKPHVNIIFPPPEYK